MPDDESKAKDAALKQKLNGRLQQLEVALATPSGSKSKSRRKKWSSMESLGNNFVEPKRSYAGGLIDRSVPRSEPTHKYATDMVQFTKSTSRPSFHKELYNSDTFLPNLLENIRNAPPRSTTFANYVGYPTALSHGGIHVDQSNVEVFSLPRYLAQPGTDADFFIKLPYQSRGRAVQPEQLVHHIFGERPTYQQLIMQESALPYVMLGGGQYDLFPTDALAVRWAHQKLYEI